LVDDIYTKLSLSDKERLFYIGRIIGINYGKLESDLREHYGTSFIRNEELRNISIIEQGARIEYMETSRKGFLAIIAKTLLYGFALYLIFKIAWHQSENIFLATGASFNKIFLY
jgi:hypothetical protein